MKKVVSLIMVFSLLMVLLPASVFANVDTNKTEDINDKKFDDYLLRNGATLEEIQSLTYVEKKSIFENTEPVSQVSENVLDEFLVSIKFDERSLSEMDYMVKLKIYESLKSFDKEELNFEGYSEHYCLISNSGEIVPASAVLKDCVKFSATAVKRVSNNIARYYVYPAAEWVQGGTALRSDAFSFGLNADHWNTPADEPLTVTGLYSGGLSYKVYPNKAKHAGRSYNFRNLIVPEANYKYKMVGCIVGEPTSKTVDKSVIFNYAQDFGDIFNLNVDIGVFSLTIKGFSRQIGDELNFRITN